MALKMVQLSLLALLPFVNVAWAQTYQRLGACPTFGCILPPDQYVAARGLSGPRTDPLQGRFPTWCIF